jgi:hypothetical protein
MRLFPVAATVMSVFVAFMPGCATANGQAKSAFPLDALGMQSSVVAISAFVPLLAGCPPRQNSCRPDRTHQ